MVILIVKAMSADIYIFLPSAESAERGAAKRKWQVLAQTGSKTSERRAVKKKAD